MNQEVPILFIEKYECCACSACINICSRRAVSMQEDEYGFFYPIIDEKKCIMCGKCKTVCAFQKSNIDNNPIKTFAAVANDDELVKKSASGGIYAAMAKKTLDDGGVAVGAVLENDFSVKHELIDSKENLFQLQGSKYSQSNIGYNYKKVKERLIRGQKVLFSGTPCQVDGLNAYLGIKFENLVTVDIICHGVPNNRMLQEYIEVLSDRLCGCVSNFLFRDKSIGWGINGSFIINGKKKKIWQSSSSYLYYFKKGWIYRESCYRCKYTCEHRPADITIGDYWGIEKQHPEYLRKNGWNESKGISVVIANTEKGEIFLNSMDGAIEFKPSEFDKAASGNAQLKRPSTPGNRDCILAIYKCGGWRALEKVFRKSIGLKYYSSQIKALIPARLKRIIKSNI